MIPIGLIDDRFKNIVLENTVDKMIITTNTFSEKAIRKRLKKWLIVYIFSP